MRRRSVVIGLGAAAALAAGGVPVLLMARGEPGAPPALDSVPAAEHAETVAALRPPKRQRPAIAVLARNAMTETCDFLSTYAVLAESGLADVIAVASRAEPIRLYPGNLQVDAQATMAQYDASYPEGADYVIVPAISVEDDAEVVAWIKAQHAKGATIVSVCNGALTLAAAGLLDGRRATGHWYSVERLRQQHPTMQWVPDRRYVADRGVATSTGVTASIPLMLAVVEAMGGRGAAETVAARLGVADWDARHASAAFALTNEHRKTFVRNRLSFWRHESIGIRLDDKVDEIALGLVADVYSRTELTTVVPIAPSAAPVQSRHGLRVRPDLPAGTATPATVLDLPREEPARAADHALADIASRYDRQTAALAALQMEYPWPEPERRVVGM